MVVPIGALVRWTEQGLLAGAPLSSPRGLLEGEGSSRVQEAKSCPSDQPPCPIGDRTERDGAGRLQLQLLNKQSS